MAKNLKGAAAPKDTQLADAVRDSAHEIWQAGLGAFEKARQEGGEVFALLVKEGVEVQKRTQNLAEHQLSGVTETVTKITDSISKQVASSLEKASAMIEDRLVRALNGLGVPTQDEVKALTEQIAQLNKSVHALQGKRMPADKPVAKKSPTKTARKSAAESVPKTAKANGRQAAKKTTRVSASRV
jgi:poly(hydroxyalkanoate) granule-associated protein